MNERQTTHYADDATLKRLVLLDRLYEAALPVADWLAGDEGFIDSRVNERFVKAVNAAQTELGPQ